MRFAILASAALAFAATCSSGQLGNDQPRNTVSPGTVTLRLLLPQGQSFCDVVNGCRGPTHVFIGKEPGNWLTLGVGPCDPVPAVKCSNACTPLPCLAGACPAFTLGVPVTNVETTWDGSTVEWSTCGSATRCFNPTFVPPGRYVARMCATPGTLAVTDSATGVETCMPTGAEECVDVPFDLPGPSPIEVPFPSSAGG